MARGGLSLHVYLIMDNVTTALFVRLEAKPGREYDVERFLRSGRVLVDDEPDTIAWFGIRLGPSTFGIFDAFPGEEGRQAHLAGKVAAGLRKVAGDLFAEPPSIQKADILASKLPSALTGAQSHARLF